MTQKATQVILEDRIMEITLIRRAVRKASETMKMTYRIYGII